MVTIDNAVIKNLRFMINHRLWLKVIKVYDSGSTTSIYMIYTTSDDKNPSIAAKTNLEYNMC